MQTLAFAFAVALLLSSPAFAAEGAPGPSQGAPRPPRYSPE